jgi:hypothetical protein
MLKRHIVTKASNDGTFQVGDHIIFYDNGDIGCLEAQGIIERTEVPEATKGMESALDRKWLEHKRQQLQQQLQNIEATLAT